MSQLKESLIKDALTVGTLPFFKNKFFKLKYPRQQLVTYTPTSIYFWSPHTAEGNVCFFKR